MKMPLSLTDRHLSIVRFIFRSADGGIDGLCPFVRLCPGMIRRDSSDSVRDDPTGNECRSDHRFPLVGIEGSRDSPSAFTDRAASLFLSTGVAALAVVDEGSPAAGAGQHLHGELRRRTYLA